MEYQGWKLSDEGLISVGSKSLDKIRWEEIIHLRLGFAPTRFKTWRHVFTVKSSSGKRIVIDNVLFRGIGDFSNQSATYVPFVKAVLERAAQIDPQKKLALGSSPFAYFFQLAWLGIAFYFLGMVLLILPLPVGGHGVNIVVKFVIIAFFLPTVFRWIMRSFPRTVRIKEISESAFPNIPK